ncbi:hypothetical protein PGT21_004765 [Puccinia graminis f. sp. tritici]|uniref:Uncharacterized protein n=1 Tax=Puccinia graminis f. sp. tritici TaxID=56615 RepID=A0A5B0MEW6_PUCGR|nr:hypothetical protein PGT21_004765 [Puccinia graminis f. sp. tritici]
MRQSQGKLNEVSGRLTRAVRASASVVNLVRIRALNPTAQPHRVRLRQDQLDPDLHLELVGSKSSTR